MKYIKPRIIKESMSQEEILELIKDSEKDIFVKYIYDYPEHDKKKSYKPVDIDNEGKITLNIDGDIYYTKLDWVEGIQEQQVFEVQYTEIKPEMADPAGEKMGAAVDAEWEHDSDFTSLLKDHGGRKGVIKKMNKEYDLDYSHCKSKRDLYVNLKHDKMLR